jgi:hypothetical protein
LIFGRYLDVPENEEKRARRRLVLTIQEAFGGRTEACAPFALNYYGP